MITGTPRKEDWEKLLKWFSDQGFGQYVQENLPEDPSDLVTGDDIAARSAYGPVTADVDTASVLSEKQAFMDANVPQVAEAKKEDKEDDYFSQLFLASLMEEMGGGKAGQAPGVVLGGRSGGLPSMMGQFRRQQKPWWIV